MMSVTTSISVCVGRTARHAIRSYHKIPRTLHSRPGYLLDGPQVHSRCFTARPHPTVDSVIRVNHAREYGADRIYAGQAAILGKTEVGHVIEVMGWIVQ